MQFGPGTPALAGLNFAANLSMLFTELPLLARIGAAAEAGFEAVEILFPYQVAAAELKAELDRHDLPLVLINTPPGDFAAGERGFAAVPGAEQRFAVAMRQAAEYARAADCPRVHVMAGIAAADAAGEATFIANLRQAAETGLTILIEPLNPFDMPGYFLSRIEQAAGIVQAVNLPNVRLQFDIYHAQMWGGDLARRLARHLPVTGHIQIAGVPGRHEPDHGEINYSFLFDLIARSGYDGYVGCEYRPRAGTLAGLTWLRNTGL